MANAASFCAEPSRIFCPKDLGIHFSDIEREARLRLWLALQSEREIRDSASYLYRIAMTATLDAVRRIKAKREEQLRLVEDEDEGAPLALSCGPNRSPEMEAGRKRLAGNVRAALARLSGNRRRAVGLYLEGMTSGDLLAQLRAEGIEYEIDK